MPISYHSENAQRRAVEISNPLKIMLIPSGLEKKTLSLCCSRLFQNSRKIKKMGIMASRMALSGKICFIRLMSTSYKEIFSQTKRMVMRPFLGDCREAYVISNSYGMGDPLASRFGKAGRTAEGGGITHPELFEMTRPGDSESKKRFHHHSPVVHLSFNLMSIPTH